MNTFATLILLAGLSIEPDSAVTPLEFASSEDIASVLTHVESDGSVFALGARWKMVFSERGATFFPILGSRAERNEGIRFALPGTTVPVLGGNRVTIDRGAFVEVYDLAVDSVEQSFVFQNRLSDGDLRLRVPIETEFDPLPRDARGLRFSAHDLGEVIYGDATILDAAGRRFDTPSTYRDGAIEIVVPEHFLDAAEFPIVVDPVISSFAVDDSLDDTENADIVFSPATNTWVVAFERAVSATDRDILVRRLTSAGAVISTSLVHVGLADTRDPAVAERSGVVLVVFARSGVAAGIQARRLDVASGAMGALFDVSPAGAPDASQPDVGSTSDDVLRPFFVVWLQGIGNSAEVAGCFSNDTGSSKDFVGTCINGYPHGPPRVMQRSAGGWWGLAHSFTGSGLGSKIDLAVCRFTTAGDGTGGSQLATGNFRDDIHPDIAGAGDGVAIVTWISVPNTGDADVMVQQVKFEGAQAGGPVDVGAIDRGGSENVEQVDAAVTFDGVRWVIAYSEREPGTADLEVRASVWLASVSGPQLVIPGIFVADTALSERDVTIAGAGAGQPGVSAIAWTKAGAIPGDDQIIGSFFSSIAPGGTTVVQTGCGTPEPNLVTQTPVIAGLTLDVTIVGAVSPLMVAGVATSVSLCPAQSSCVLGATPLVVSPVPATFKVPLAGDPALVGFAFALQVIDLLPVNTLGAYCGPPKYAQKFRVSDTHVITIQ